MGFFTLYPQEARKAGNKLILRSDWNEVKLQVMEEVTRYKYFYHLDLAKLLLATEDAYLEEGNYWNDTFWGVCKGVGENHLGKILMKIRSELLTAMKNLYVKDNSNFENP